MESIYTKALEINIKEIGQITKKMEMENIYIQMEICTMEILEMEKKMVLVS